MVRILLFRKDCRKPHAILAARFLQAFPGFFRFGTHIGQAAEFAASAGPARLFVLRLAAFAAENAAKSAIGKLGPAFASALTNKFFLADHKRASVSDIQDFSCRKLCGGAGKAQRQQGGRGLAFRFAGGHGDAQGQCPGPAVAERHFQFH
jgi:hypothetical protein